MRHIIETKQRQEKYPMLLQQYQKKQLLQQQQKTPTAVFYRMI